MEQFKQVCKQAGLTEAYWQMINGQEFITLEGLKKLRDSFIADGDMECTKKFTQIISQAVKMKGRKR